MPPNASISEEEKTAIPPEHVSEQVQRIIRSETFRGSEVLRHLLEYLGLCFINGRTDSVKVRDIARDVFGRSESFDSQTDSVVRVHTGRLRSKLAEYYMEEGCEDELILGIPKGGYNLACHQRKPSPSAVLTIADAAAPIPESAHSIAGYRGHPVRIALAGAALVVLLALAAAWPFIRSRSVTNLQTPGPAVATLWRPFTRDQPIIVFSTFRLGGSLDTEVHPLTAEASSPGEINTYTTTGEVMGVFEVSRMLAGFGQSARAKHGRLLTWDEAKDSNLIFVGGPLAQTPLRNLPPMNDLQFRKGWQGVPPSAAAIVNIHPQSGEQAVYPGPTARPFRVDYAIIAVKPTFNPKRRALILAGITEFGTQGAADFVGQEDRVSELLNRLHVKPGAPLPCFEALIRVNIESDVPVQYELLLARVTK